MPIISNPQVQRFIIPVANGKVLLVLRGYKTDEYTKFMGSRFGFGNGKISDESMRARLDFIDTLLVDIAAVDKSGQPDYVTYSVGGKEERLTPQVENWVQYVNPSWKLSVAFELENVTAHIEDEIIKN